MLMGINLTQLGAKIALSRILAERVLELQPKGLQCSRGKI